ncbi:MAG: DegV family protein, partial [Acidimicrobiales bacterium]
MTVKIVTDSSCDLPDGLVSELGIDVVPLTIRFGAEELVDRRDLTPAQFWARCGTSDELPSTASPAPGAVEEVFRAAAAAGAEGVMCVVLSSKLSATGEAAQAGARALVDVVPVKVVDSLSVSLGHGMMA